MKENKKIGLALSGGGFRAAAFHIGALKKLKELGILDNIDVISSISGGSILSAYYGLNCKNFEKFENDMINVLKKGVIGINLFKDWKLISFIFLLITSFIIGFIVNDINGIVTVLLVWIAIYTFSGFYFFPIGRVIYDAYDRILFHGKTLKDLPDTPKIAINASNLDTGRLMTFSKNKISDSKYKYQSPNKEPINFNSDIFPLSKAVYASSCVPQCFSPLRIDKKYFKNQEQYAYVSPTLIDGCIYDNQGISKITQKGSEYLCDYVIVSDAGNGEIKTDSKYWKNNFWLLLQVIELFFTRVRNLQMMKNVYTDGHEGKRIAFISLKWNVENCVKGFVNNIINGKVAPEIIQMHNITETEIQNKDEEKMLEKIKKNIDYKKIQENDTTTKEYDIAVKIGTNLTPLKKKQIECLIKRAEVITEIQVKLYCPDLIKNTVKG